MDEIRRMLNEQLAAQGAPLTGEELARRVKEGEPLMQPEFEHEVISKNHPGVGLWHQCPVCGEEVFNHGPKANCPHCNSRLKFPQGKELRDLLSMCKA